MKDKATLKQLLIEKHEDFIAYIQSLSDEELTRSPEGKWTATQQVEHLCLSLRRLVMGMRLPAFVTRMIVGKANRPSRSYHELVAKYQSKLSQGGKAPSAYIPKAVPADQRARLLKALNNQLRVLIKQLEKRTEKQLDEQILPHPLLGKITMREMMYFTIYHVGHHQKLIQQYLEAK